MPHHAILGPSAPNGRKGNVRRICGGGGLGRVWRVKFKLVCTNTNVSLCWSHKRRKFIPVKEETSDGRTNKTSIVRSTIND